LILLKVELTNAVYLKKIYFMKTKHFKLHLRQFKFKVQG